MEERGPLRRRRETRGTVTHRANRGPHLSRAASQPPSPLTLLGQDKMQCFIGGRKQDLSKLLTWFTGASNVPIQFREILENIHF